MSTDRVWLYMREAECGKSQHIAYRSDILVYAPIDIGSSDSNSISNASLGVQRAIGAQQIT